MGMCVMYCIRMLSPRVYTEMLDARSLLGDWIAGRQVTHWPPLVLPLVMVLAEYQFACGAPAVAVAFLVAYTGLLRGAELSALRVRDCILLEDERFPSVRFFLLVLVHTKTGDDKTAELREKWLWPALRRLLAVRARGGGQNGRVFPTQPVLRRALGQSLEYFGLGGCGFAVHSLRGGGALGLQDGGASVDEVLRRGRWRRPESARPYIQRLRALAAYQDVPAAILARGCAALREPSEALAHWWV